MLSTPPAGQPVKRPSTPHLMVPPEVLPLPPEGEELEEDELLPSLEDEDVDDDELLEEELLPQL